MIDMRTPQVAVGGLTAATTPGALALCDAHGCARTVADNVASLDCQIIFTGLGPRPRTVSFARPAGHTGSPSASAPLSVMRPADLSVTLDDGTGIAVPGSKLAAGQPALIVGRAPESSTRSADKPIRTLIGLGQDALLGHFAEGNAALRERVAQLESQQARIAALEARLAAPATVADATGHGADARHG